MHRFNILIIDDDEDDYLIIRSLLEDISQEPLHLDWASSYAEGEKLLAENRHSVCLMDYQLGAKNGIELLKVSPHLGFTGPIILLTGIHQGEVDMLALEAGAVDYLVKNSLTSEQLARAIRYALGRREMETERIERLRAEAENRSKSEFLAHLSHELRTPLSAILGFTELLMNSQQTEDNLAQIGVIHRNGKHLLGLLNDILDLSKIEAGKLDLTIQSIELMPFLADIYSLMLTAATDKNLSLNFVAKSPLPEIIYSDPTRLRQVLLNLIGNAIKFTHEGKVELLIDTQLINEKHKIIFNVQDSGIGISKNNVKTIFEPFVQIKNARIQTRTGSGLGLTISRQLVEHMGGQISVTSQENIGSSFNFYIDAGDLHSVNFKELSLNYVVDKLRNIEIPQQFKGRILVVDDLRDIRTLIGHYVTRCGLQVDFASNGLEAINKLIQAAESLQHFDLVLMDIHMPVKDGIITAREIRSLGYSCPLIALTAAHMKGDEEIYLKAGFNASLSKPVDQTQMVHLLNQYLGEAKIVSAVLDSKKEDTPQTHSSEIIEQPKNKLILVVEDSIDALDAMKNILELLGWNPITATDAKTALHLAKNLNPHYALVDINLPDADGYELSRKLSEIIPGINIFLSSGSEFDPAKTCIAIKGHFLKPISIQQLRGLDSHDLHI
jgi:signal transduction histidine kinase